MIDTAPNATDFAAARRHMIESQLRTSGINDAFVLDRMAHVPRENYLPENARASAYVDRTVPLGDGISLAPPVAHGQILTHARPRHDERTLVVGPATGYLAELLRPLVADLQEATCESVLAGDVEGAFDLIVVDGAAEELPAQLITALKPEGRVVTGINRKGVTRLEMGRRSGEDISLFSLTETQLPRLPAFDKPQSWTF